MARLPRIDGYVRVSQVRGREGDSFISPASQEDRIRGWARLHGFEVAEVHVELDQSGAKANRPKLLEALARVESGDTGGIVVARLDRFGRSLTDALAAIERVERAGGRFASVADGFDLASDTGRLVLRIMLSLAEFELDRIRGNFAEARARAVARGVHVSPVPPCGYRRRADGGLEPDPASAAVIGEVFAKRASGVAVADLTRLLEAAGVKGAYGHERWTARAVKSMVRNRVYLGEARHGEYVSEGAHAPLTDATTWRQAQRSGSVNPARSGIAPALLSGLIRCAGCRHGMGNHVARGRRQYRCHRKFPAGVCPEPAYIAINSGIEDYVVGEFFRAVADMRATPAADDGALADLEAAAATAHEALTAFRDDPRIVATLGVDSFAEGLAVRQQALDGALDALGDARRDLDARQLPVADLRSLWPSLDTGERRRLLAGAIEGVFVKRGRGRYGDVADHVLISWHGEGIEVPRRGKREPRELLPPLRFEQPTRAGMAAGE